MDGLGGVDDWAGLVPSVSEGGEAWPWSGWTCALEEENLELRLEIQAGLLELDFTLSELFEYGLGSLSTLVFERIPGRFWVGLVLLDGVGGVLAAGGSEEELMLGETSGCLCFRGSFGCGGDCGVFGRGAGFFSFGESA